MRLAALICLLCVVGCEAAAPVAIVEPIATPPIAKLTPQPKIPDAVPAPQPKPSVADWLAGIIPDAKLPTIEQVAEIAERIEPEPVPVPEPVAEATPAEPPVGLYFWAAWCGPCKEPHAIVDEFVADGLNVKTIDADAKENQALMQKYGVGALPTLVKIDADGRMLDKLVGKRSREQIAAFYGFTPSENASAPNAAPELRTATPRVYACGGHGSGTVIEPGRLLTCAHVVIDELTGEYRSPIRIMFGDELIPAEVVGSVLSDEGGDLALLSFDAETEVIPVAEAIADVNGVFTTHGYPNGKPQQAVRRVNLWNARMMNGRQELATGSYRFASQAFIPGESGGGVTDASGKLVGVISATDGRMGYVVSLESIRKFLAAQ